MTNCDRARLILETAARAGLLVSVSAADAASWRRAWHGLRASVLAPAPRTPRPEPDRRHRLPRCVFPAPSLLNPGTWVRFRPLASSAHPGFLLCVLGIVPPGVGVAEVLPASLLPLLDSRVAMAPSPRYSRVLLGEPGGRRAFARVRCTLIGSFAARAVAVPVSQLPAELVAEDQRLPEPLPPGSPVSWSWHSRHGESSLHGIVLAYVPAMTPLQNVLPPDVPCPRSLLGVSEQDRYLVRLDGCSSLRTPAAHLVERRAADGEAS